MKKFVKKGAIAIAPLALSIAIISWLFSFLEEFFGPPLKALVGHYYFTGLGVIAALIILFIIGVLLNTWIFSRLSAFFDNILSKIPLFKSIYSMIKNVTQFFEASTGEKEQQVVAFEINGMTLIGFVTCKDFSKYPSLPSDQIAVFLPMSYQIGGYTIFVPKSSVRPLDIKMEHALQNVLIAWTHKSKKL